MKNIFRNYNLGFRNSNKGFTLIELLVVVAIIGILSSIVLASLNQARQRGKNAAIKANVANARAAAELYYDDNAPDGYDGVCDPTPPPTPPLGGIKPMVDALEDLSSDVICNDDNDYWVLAAELASYVCTDHTGVLVTVNKMSKNATVCPAEGGGGGGPIPIPQGCPPVCPIE